MISILSNINDVKEETGPTIIDMQARQFRKRKQKKKEEKRIFVQDKRSIHTIFKESPLFLFWSTWKKPSLWMQGGI